MHIHIHDEVRLREIQEVFANYYPYLKLTFNRTPHKAFAATPENEALPGDLRIKDIRKTHTDGILLIQPTETVASLEKELQDRFNLYAQVCRIERGQWVQTTGMDTFILKELNEISPNDSDEFLVSDYEEGFETAG